MIKVEPGLDLGKIVINIGDSFSQYEPIDNTIIERYTQKQYKNYVKKQTNKNKEKYSYILNPFNMDITGWNIDHIAPIDACYKVGIPAKMCADIRNLQLLPESENRIKGNTLFTSSCSIALKQDPKESYQWMGFDLENPQFATGELGLTGFDFIKGHLFTFRNNNVKFKNDKAFVAHKRYLSPLFSIDKKDKINIKGYHLSNTSNQRSLEDIPISLIPDNVRQTLEQNKYKFNQLDAISIYPILFKNNR